MRSHESWIALKAALGAALLACWLAAAAAAPEQAQVERRLSSVKTLIEQSSAARQIESSHSAAAAAKRELARELHTQAAQALRAGDLPGASRLLDTAATTMLEATRLAAPEEVTAAKDRRDFDARMQSTRALLDAHKRVAQEKSAQSTPLIQEIEAMLQRADALVARGELAAGRALLDQAYLANKAALANLRSGDTLVRTLHFATKEEEYRYEVDRNDTHQMLVQLLLREKRANPSTDAMVQSALGEAARLRKLAESQAAKRDHEAAVKTLEQSTKELVRAIRGAGVYIPG